MDLRGFSHGALEALEGEVGAARDLGDRLFAPGAEPGGIGDLARDLARDHHGAVAFGGWMSGAIYDLTGSYRAAFLNGIAWNLLNLSIALWLLLGRLRPWREQAVYREPLRFSVRR